MSVTLEYAKRLAGASLAEIAAAGGGIWASVLATRAASDSELLSGLSDAYARILAGGVTTLEVKSGYGLTLEEELRQLELLERSRAMTPMQLVVTFLGAHVVPAGIEAEGYVSEVHEMLDAVVERGLGEFHDITCERGLFTPGPGVFAVLAISRARGSDAMPRRRVGVFGGMADRGGGRRGVGRASDLHAG